MKVKGVNTAEVLKMESMQVRVYVNARYRFHYRLGLLFVPHIVTLHFSG